MRLKRPLSVLCLFYIIGVFLFYGFRPPAYASYGEYAGEEVTLTGRVYAKEFKEGEKGLSYLFLSSPMGSFMKIGKFPMRTI